MWWTEVINKNCLPSRIIFSEHTPWFCFPDERCAMHKARGWHGSNPTHQMSGGRGGREGTTRAILCPRSPNVEGCSTKNQHSHSHQNTDQHNSRGDGCGRVWPQGSSYWHFFSFQPFLAQGFPKTDVGFVHLSCMNFFSPCWSPHKFFGTSIHSWSRHCGCPTSTGLTWEGAPPFLCVLSFFSLPPGLCGGKKKSENPVPVLPDSASMFSTSKGQSAWHTQHWGGLWFKLFLFPVSFPK